MRATVKCLAVLAVTGLVAAGAGVARAADSAPVFNVRGYGATGDGTTNDSPAVDAAITAANAAGGGIVQFPPGTYLAGGSIHLKSNVTVQLDAGATLLGAPSGYDVPEPNPFDAYQDFGHSHFHDAMIWGDNLSNIGFTGAGTIDGGGNFITGNPKPGQADKLISLTRCTGLTVGGITLKRGGHFAMLINGCTNVTSDHLTIATADDRDGWNIISTTNVTITNADIAANDDALVFKSDYALGAKLPNGNVRVTDAHLSAGCCNALMFGSETCGDFTNYRFDRIAITGANKSGLGLVSMDGADISDVHYSNITMTGVSSPIMQKIGTRRRCGNNPGVGHISNITYENITATGKSNPEFSATLWGESGDNRISDVTFVNVHLTVPGGHAAMPLDPPSNDPNNYNPNSIGVRPAYGFYLHNVDRATFSNSSFGFAAGDDRPAFIANAGSTVALHHVTAQRGTGSPFDLGFQSVDGYCVTNSRDTAGARLRLSTPDSTPACNAGIDNFSISVSPATQPVTAGSTVTYAVRTAVVTGKPGDVTLSATGQPAGTSVSFSPNLIRPGGTASMTVTTTPGVRNGTYTLTVIGTNATATQYARVGLVVTGGVDLRITNLAVADTANAADWSVQTNLKQGDLQYGDRTFAFATVPSTVLGATWIRTANDSKSATAEPLVTFTISAPATVLVAVDTRLDRRPWMDATWVSTDVQLTNTESGTRTFQVFAKTYPAGPVSLGPNAGSTNSSMYTIIVV
jgi:Glycosyl hydrolases family 28